MNLHGYKLKRKSLISLLKQTHENLKVERDKPHYERNERRIKHLVAKLEHLVAKLERLENAKKYCIARIKMLKRQKK